MENNKSFIREVTLSDLWRIFLQRLWIMLLAMVLVAGGLTVYNRLTYVPRYNSTATLYILKQQNEVTTPQYGQQYEDFTLALKVVNDCDYLLKSKPVLKNVIKELGMEETLTYPALRGSISTNNPEDTRILTVTVEADTPENARDLVNKVCDLGVVEITRAMGFEQVMVYDHGSLNTAPCNTESVMTYLLAGFVAMAAVYAIFLLTFLFDDRLKTDEEIERALELTVIGDIPNAEGTKNRKYGYYRYGKYGKYSYGSKYAYGKYGYGETQNVVEAQEENANSAKEQEATPKNNKNNKKKEN